MVEVDIRQPQMPEKACWCSKWAGYIESRKEPWKYVRDRIPLWCIVKQILSVRGSIPLHTTIILTYEEEKANCTGKYT